MTALDRAEKLTELESIQEQTVGRAPARERLAELLADGDDEVRAAAAAAVGLYTEDEALVQAALRLATEAPNVDVRVAAVSSLGQVVRAGVLAGAEGEGYAPETELGEPTAETYAAVKAALLDTLASVSDDVELKELLGPTDAKDWALKSATVLALSPLSTHEQVVAGIEQLRAQDLATALRCMGRGGDPRWQASVVEALDHDDAAVALAAIDAAGRVEAVEAVPFLSRVLKGSRQPTPRRVAAAAALGALGGQHTATALLEVAEDEADEEVRGAARLALTDLTLLSDDEQEEKTDEAS